MVGVWSSKSAQIGQVPPRWLGIGTLSRKRLGEQVRHQLLGVAIIRNHQVGAGANEPVALPGVDPLAIDFVTGDGHGDPADALYFFYLDEPIAERQEFRAVKAVL